MMRGRQIEPQRSTSRRNRADKLPHQLSHRGIRNRNHPRGVRDKATAVVSHNVSNRPLGAERWGSGIRRMRLSMEEAGLDPPAIEADRNWFRIVFYGPGRSASA